MLGIPLAPSTLNGSQQAYPTLNSLRKQGNGTMILQSPICITARLLPGVKIDNAFVSISYSKRAGSEGRTRYRWHIGLPEGEYTGDDLQSGCQGGSLQEGLESLLCFLGACGESWRYSGPGEENADLFPQPVAEWAAQNADELTMLEYELQEQPNLIRE